MILANPAAIERNVRYVDEDLNRCFLVKHLSDPDTYGSLEHRRARELDALLGPKLSPNPAADFIIECVAPSSISGHWALRGRPGIYKHDRGTLLKSVLNSIQNTFRHFL